MVLDYQVKQEMNLSSPTQIEEEFALYRRLRIPDGTIPTPVDWQAVLTRRPQEIIEATCNLPQNLFYIDWNGKRIVGRKLISELKLRGELKELNCSGVTASMLLGLFKGETSTVEQVSVTYNPFLPAERLSLFADIKRRTDIELVYPFRFLDKEHRRERTSPPDGWSLNPMRADNLGRGEEHIRQYTVAYLVQFALAGKILYDPACSTGQFLHTLKLAYPNCHTIGQDLSKQMTDYARAFVDEIYTGDAYLSFIPDEYVDIAFCRFLNSEVVTTDQARVLFPRIAQRVKRGGYIIVFGHTPVLLTKHFFESCGLHVQQTLAYHEERDIFFQYYVLKK